MKTVRVLRAAQIVSRSSKYGRERSIDLRPLLCQQHTSDQTELQLKRGHYATLLSRTVNKHRKTDQNTNAVGYDCSWTVITGIGADISLLYDGVYPLVP